MGVYKRGDIFWIDYYSHGQRVREAVSGSRRDAEAALRDRRTDIDRGVFHRIAKKERITFEEAIAEYKIEKADKRSLKRDDTSFKHLSPYSASGIWIKSRRRISKHTSGTEERAFPARQSIGNWPF